MADRTVSVRLQAEIGQYVAGMTKAAAVTKGVGESAEKSSSRASKGFSIAGKGAALLGVGVGAALVGIAAKSMDFEKAMSGAAAATQTSGMELSKLRDAAMKAGADTQYSASEAASAITEMGKAGVSTADILGGGLNGALALAAAGQLDVGKAAEIASTAMTQFRLSGEDLPHVADLLAAGAGKAQGSVEDLGAALNQSGLIASGAGLEIEETTGTLAAFASAGLIGSDAGTSFKTMLQRLQAPVGDAAELMKQLGISLYDAQGNTLGMSEVAGQLQTALADMTPAARDNALAVMFGSDAVRAANVLYQQGASGIQTWTDKVNDQGFAAEQAAALTDNLAGDLERLGGSFDTLLITLGSGAQGGMRELVQMLEGVVEGVTWAVEGFSDLPGPVKAAAAAMLVWAVAGGKIMTAISGLKTSGAGKVFDDLRLRMMIAKEEATGLRGRIGAVGSAAGTAASTGLKAFAGAVGPELLAAVAVGGLALVAENFNKIAHAGDAAREQVDEITGSLSEMGNAGRLDSTRASIDQLRDSLAAVQAVTEAKGGDQGWFASLLGPTAVIAGQGSAMKDAAESAEVYRDAIADLEEKQRAVDETSRTLAGTFRMSQDEVLALADKYKIDLSGSVSETRRLFENFYATEYGEKPTQVTADFADAATGAAEAVDEAKKSVDQYKLSLDILSGATVSNMEVESAFQDALAEADGAVKDLDGSVKKANGSLNLNSEAGRAASDVLLNVRDSGNQLIATMIQNGATTAEVTKKDKELRTSFIKSAMQMGFNKGEARKLADQILGIPAERETQIKADTKAAKTAVDGVQTSIDNLKGRQVFIDVAARTGRTVAQVEYLFNKQNFWDGGYTGDGGKFEPKGVVHGGEYVITKERTAKLGVGTLENLERILPGYAAGGPVGVNVNLRTGHFDDVINGWAKKIALKAIEPGTGTVAALNFARSQVGKPYLWGGAGPGGYDCSGFMSALTNVIRGRNPYSRVGSTASFPWPGFRPGFGPFTIGSTKNAGGGIGHMAGTLGGVNVESAGGVGVRVGGSARGASDSLFGTRAHLAMFNGGVIGEPVVGIGARSGNTYSFGERGPETVMPGIRSREFSGGTGGRGGAGGGANVVVNARVFVGDREITDIVRTEATAVVGGAFKAGNRALSAAGVRV